MGCTNTSKKKIVKQTKDWCMSLIPSDLMWEVFGLSPRAVPPRPRSAPGREGGRTLLLLLHRGCFAPREMDSSATEQLPVLLCCTAMEPTLHHGMGVKKAGSL